MSVDHTFENPSSAYSRTESVLGALLHHDDATRRENGRRWIILSISARRGLPHATVKIGISCKIASRGRP